MTSNEESAASSTVTPSNEDSVVPPSSEDSSVVTSTNDEEDSILFCTQLFSEEFLEDNETKVPDGNHGPQSLALLRGFLWPNRSVLRVRFVGGSNLLHDKVVYYASQWSNYANISFTFRVTGAADIIVSFVRGGGHWSFVGTGSKRKSSQNEPTMNLGLSDYSGETEFRRVITHEFGHAIGCVHEHQSPVANIPWNKPKVYEHYARTQKWSREVTEHNLFNPYSKSQSFYSAFDPKSIMIYSIPRSLTTNGFSVGWNTELSAYDKAFIAQVYAK